MRKRIKNLLKKMSLLCQESNMEKPDRRGAYMMQKVVLSVSLMFPSLGREIYCLSAGRGFVMENWQSQVPLFPGLLAGWRKDAGENRRFLVSPGQWNDARRAEVPLERAQKSLFRWSLSTCTASAEHLQTWGGGRTACFSWSTWDGPFRLPGSGATGLLEHL